MKAIDELILVRKIIFELLEEIKSNLLEIQKQDEIKAEDLQKVINLIIRYTS